MGDELKDLEQEYRDMEDNPLIAKSLDFSVRIVNLCKCLRDERHETVMSKQIAALPYPFYF